MSAKRRKASSSKSNKHSPGGAAPSWGLVATVAVTATLPLVARYTIATSTGAGFGGAQGLVWFGVAIVGAFGAAVVDAMRRKAIVLPRSRWLAVAAALLVAGAVVSAARAESAYAAMIGAVQVGLVGLYLLTVLLVARGRRAVLWLVAALVAGAVASAAVSVFENAVWTPEQLMAYFEEYREPILREQGIEPGSIEEEMFRRRIEGDYLSTFHHPNLFASAMAVAALVGAGVLVGGLARRRDGADQPKAGPKAADRQRLVAALVMVPLVALMCVTLWRTEARAAVGALAIGAYVLAVLGLVRRPAARAAWLGGAAAVAVAGGAVLLQNERFASALSSLRFRWDYWQGTWRMIAEHPWLGVGPGGFSGHYLEHKLATAPEEVNHPHNALLWAWSELGLAGATGLVASAVAALGLAWRKPRPVVEGPTDERSLLRRLVPVMVLAALLIITFELAAADDLTSDVPRMATTALTLALTAALLLAALPLPMAAVVALDMDADPELATRRWRWIRCGLVAALVAFAVQAQVSLTVPHLPNFAQCACLVALLAATGDGEPWRVSLERPRRRGLAASVMLGVLAGYVGLVAWPVVGAQAELADAMRYPVNAPEHRQHLEQAAAHCPTWAQPYVAMARADWMLAGQPHLAGPQRRELLERSLSELEQAHRLEPRDLNTVVKMVQTADLLAARFGDAAMALRALELRGRLTAVYPTKADFRAAYAVDLATRSDRADEARTQATEALRLDDLVTDPLRKLDAEVRSKLSKIVRP